MYEWGDFYFGLGGETATGVGVLSTSSIPITANRICGFGYLGEATVGYDHLFGRRLIGVYGTARFGNVGPQLDTPFDSISAEGKYGFDALVRLGYAVTPNTLGYVLSGYAWQHNKLDAIPLEWNTYGWVVGFGAERVLQGKWTLKKANTATRIMKRWT